MTWTALWQTAMPMIIFFYLEDSAVLDYDRKVIVRNWQEIMFAYVGMWGPLFFMGLFSLSGAFTKETAFFIEHFLSNFQIPVYLYTLWILIQTLLPETLIPDRGIKSYY